MRAMRMHMNIIITAAAVAAVVAVVAKAPTAN